MTRLITITALAASLLLWSVPAHGVSPCEEMCMMEDISCQPAKCGHPQCRTCSTSANRHTNWRHSLSSLVGLPCPAAQRGCNAKQGCDSQSECDGDGHRCCFARLNSMLSWRQITQQAQIPMIPVPVGPPPTNFVKGFFTPQQYQQVPLMVAGQFPPGYGYAQNYGHLQGYGYLQNQGGLPGQGYGYLQNQGGLPGQNGLSGQGGLPGQGYGYLQNQGGLPGQNGLPGQSGLLEQDGLPGQGGLSGQGDLQGLSGLSGQGGLPGLNGLPEQGGLLGLNGLSGQGGLPGLNGLPGQGGLLGLNGLPGYGDQGYGIPQGYGSLPGYPPGYGYYPVPQQVEERIVYVPYTAPPQIQVNRMPMAPRPPIMRRMLGDANTYEYPEMPQHMYTTRGARDFLAPNPPGIGE